MKGYVAKKGNQFYAVIYEGLDPVTGKEKRTWHPAGPDRAAAEQFAHRLATEAEGPNDQTRSLTFGAYLTEQWLPGKANTLAESTWHSYRRKIERHILPTLGRIPIRRLKVADLERLYDSKLRPTEPGMKPLAPKTVLEIHLIIRGALTAAVKRGILTRNVATVAHAPRLRSIPKHEPQAWTADQLSQFLQAAVGPRPARGEERDDDLAELLLCRGGTVRQRVLRDHVLVPVVLLTQSGEPAAVRGARLKSGRDAFNRRTVGRVGDGCDGCDDLVGHDRATSHQHRHCGIDPGAGRHLGGERALHPAARPPCLGHRRQPRASLRLLDRSGQWAAHHCTPAG